MARAHQRSQLALPIVVIVTIAVALLPARWRLGWQTDFAEVVRFPLRPFTHAGNALAGWLRPAPTISQQAPHDASLVDQLIEEREIVEALYQRERLRTLELEEQIRQLELIPSETLRYASARLIAHITRRRPDSALGIVELKLERSAAEAVQNNTVAVYGGVHVLGRTVGESTEGVCLLQPLGNRASGYIRVRVFPRDEPGAPVERAALVQLEPTGGGDLIGAISQDAAIEPGDVVRLDDPAWPPTAQMLVVGHVESVEPDEREPLRDLVRVQPRFEASRVAYVTLIVEQPGTAPEETGP
jgi:hypothetical protein